MAKKKRYFGVFHGTPSKEFDKFDTSGYYGNENLFAIGSHFGTFKAAKDVLDTYYRKNDSYRILKAIIRLNNPIRLKDNFGAYTGITKIADDILIQNALNVKAGNNYRRLNLFSEALKSRIESKKLGRGDNGRNIIGKNTLRFANKLIRDTISELGYDGVVYENLAEDKGSTSYIALDPNQIKILSQKSDGRFTKEENEMLKRLNNLPHKDHKLKLKAIQHLDPYASIKGLRRLQRPTLEAYRNAFTNDEGEVNEEKASLYFGMAADAYAKKSFYGTRGNSDPLEYMYPKKNKWAGYDTAWFKKLLDERDIAANPFVGPMPPDGFNFMGPRYSGDGFERHRTNARLNEIKSRFNYDMMDDFDQKMHNLTERYDGNRSMADASLRNMLKKELGPFFKNSRMSTKDLHGLAKGYSAFRKIPILGGLTRMITNPTGASIAGLLSAFGTASSLLNQRDASNLKTTDWARMSGVAGTASERFRKAAESAGLKGPDIDSHWAKLMSKFGNPEAVEAFSNMPPGIAKSRIAADLGLDGYDFAIADYLSGRTEKKINRDVKRRNRIETVAAHGMSTGTSFSTKLNAWRYSFDLLKPVYSWLESLAEENYKKGYITKRQYEEGTSVGAYKNVLDTVNNIANGDISYQQSAAYNPSPMDYIAPGRREVSVHIDTAEFNDIRDYEDVKNKIKSRADEVAERHEAAEAYGPIMR